MNWFYKYLLMYGYTRNRERNRGMCQRNKKKIKATVEYCSKFINRLKENKKYKACYEAKRLGKINVTLQ